MIDSWMDGMRAITERNAQQEAERLDAMEAALPTKKVEIESLLDAELLEFYAVAYGRSCNMYNPREGKCWEQLRDHAKTLLLQRMEELNHGKD